MVTSPDPAATSGGATVKRPGPILAAAGKSTEPPRPVIITPAMVAAVTRGQVDDLLDRLISEYRSRASQPALQEDGRAEMMHRQTMRDLAALLAIRELVSGSQAAIQQGA